METADVAVPEAHQAQREFYRSSRPHREPLFSPEGQKAFDKAFKKREVKLRKEFEEREASLRNDVLEMVWACEQLLFKKLSPQQAQDIARGVGEIKRDYERVEEQKCKTQ